MGIDPGSDGTPSAPVLEMHGIVKSFGGVHALRSADLEVHAGEVLALLGENGAGKSTLMNVLSGVVAPDAGRLLIDGHERQFASPADAQAAGVAMIHQELDLVPHRSVVDNLFLGNERRTAWRTIDAKGMAAEAQALLDDVGITISPARHVDSMRVGEQQMVAIAKALRLQARILVMDEPTSALSDTEVRRLFEIIPELRRRGVAVIFISHRMDEIAQVADRGVVMRDGESVGTFDVAGTPPSEVVRMMIGKPLDQVFPLRPPPGDDVRLRVRGLSLDGGRGARSEPRDVDLDVRRGEIVGLAGLLGAGRSELLEALYGLAGHRLTGTVELDGAPVSITSPEAALACGIGYVPEDRRAAGLVMQESVAGNIVLGVLRALATLGWRSKDRERARVSEAVDSLAIKTRSPATIVSTLSGGNQQKVVFARNLLREPRVLLLDEPTRGVDVGAKAEIYHLLADLAGGGVSVLVASSELPELVGLCDRIAVMRNGRIVTVLDRDEVSQERLLYAAGMEHAVSDPAPQHVPEPR
ncbi:sugar ABC transporter ATP-binding protein [Georgenia faecalis]|uniref:Sugar ABC transporter ATP-binding protein n=1 Tax=Georgenia faecalis TaxID=2483799 RepID=A0ABV9DA16_9MICO|nr:sugar ABC transporter ATP-binding protein [Georgenia faecalis]